MRDFDKIIIIGKNKSGTTSLCEALSSLGLREENDNLKKYIDSYLELFKKTL